MRKILTRLFETTWWVPLLYLVLNHHAVRGHVVFYHDTRDGLAAFKFALLSPTLIPAYWNWLDMTGVPFWLDMGWFRVQDPLMWLPLLVLKALPFGIEHKFNLYMLFRIFLLGVGLGLLFKEFRFQTFVRNACVAMVLFGGLGQVFFPSVGMLDTTFGLTFLLYFGIRFFKTRNALFALLWSAFFVHATLSYHILYIICVLGITFLLSLGFIRGATKEVFEALKSNVASLVVVAMICGASLASVFLATKQKNLTPILRNIPFNSTVSPDGICMTPGLQYGNSIYSWENMTHKSSECGTDFYCAELSPSDLMSLVRYERVWETNCFITFLGLISVLVGVFFVRTRLFWLTLTMTVFSLLCGLGHHTPFYPFFQGVLPIPGWVRHTEFFTPFFVVGLILMAGQALTHLLMLVDKSGWLTNRRKIAGGVFLAGYFSVLASQVVTPGLAEKRFLLVLGGMALLTIYLLRKKAYAPLLVSLALGEGVLLYIKVAHFYRLQPDPLRTIISETMPTEFRSRQYRVLNLDYGPRWFDGVVAGTATAFEGGDNFTQGDKDTLNFLNIPSFSVSGYLEARLAYADNLKASKKVFGVSPEPVFRLYPTDHIEILSQDRALNARQINEDKLLLDPSKTVLPVPGSSPSPTGESTPLRVQGNELTLAAHTSAPGWAYLSLPYAIIDEVTLDGRPISFQPAQDFGIAFPLPAGQSHLVIHPDTSTARVVYALYYGSYLTVGLCIVGVLLAQLRRLFSLFRFRTRPGLFNT